MKIRPNVEVLERRDCPAGTWSPVRRQAYQLLDAELSALQQIKHPGPFWTQPAPDAETAIGMERLLLSGSTGVPGKPQFDDYLTSATDLLTSLPASGVPSGVRLIVVTAWRVAVQVDRLLTQELQDVNNEYVTVQAGGDADLAASDLLDGFTATADDLRPAFQEAHRLASQKYAAYRAGQITENQYDEAEFTAEVAGATYTQAEWLAKNFARLLPAVGVG